MSDLLPQVAVIMGSHSDWATLSHTIATLDELGVPNEARVVSAHRTPDLLFSYVSDLQARGVRVLIAGAGGAAHLPGMAASKTVLPVIGVPVQSRSFNGVDSLLSIVQMPAGVPVATMAVGQAGAINAALFAASILALHDPQIALALAEYRHRQTSKIIDHPDPRTPPPATLQPLDSVTFSAKK